VSVMAACPKCGVEAQADVGIDNWLIVRCRVCGRQGRRPLSGIELRDQGIASVSSNASMLTWRSIARRELETLAKSGSEFSADDVTSVSGMPSEPNAVGALFATAHKQGLIKPVGTRTGVNPQRHAGSQRVWVGARR
jgi:hypothetical protein